MNKRLITYSACRHNSIKRWSPLFFSSSYWACFHNPYTRSLRPLTHCIALPIKGTPICEMHIIFTLNLNQITTWLLSLVGKPHIIGNLAYLNGSRLDGDHFGVILLLEKWQEHRTFTEVHSLKELFQKNLSISNFLYFSQKFKLDQLFQIVLYFQMSTIILLFTTDSLFYFPNL